MACGGVARAGRVGTGAKIATPNWVWRRAVSPAPPPPHRLGAVLPPSHGRWSFRPRAMGGWKLGAAAGRRQPPRRAALCHTRTTTWGVHLSASPRLPPPPSPQAAAAAAEAAAEALAARASSEAAASTSKARRGRPRNDGLPSTLRPRGRPRSATSTAPSRSKAAKAAAAAAAAAAAPTETAATPPSRARAAASRRAEAGRPRRRRTGAAAAATADATPLPKSSKATKAAARLGAPPSLPDPLSLYTFRSAALAAAPPPSAVGSEEAADLALLRKLDAGLRRGRDAVRAAQAAGVGDPVSAFIKALGHTAVLSRDAETRLGDIIYKGIRVASAGDDLAAKLGRAPTSDEVAESVGLADTAHLALLLGNRVAATDLLAQYNLRLVVHAAKRYKDLGHELPDLIAEGVVGLLRAIDKFDGQRGHKFSTYAMWWIRQAVTRSISEQSRMVRLPVHIYEAVAKIRRAKRDLVEEADAATSGGSSIIDAADPMSSTVDAEVTAAVALRTGIAIDKVVQYVAASRPAASIDVPLTSSTVGLPDDPFDNIGDLIECPAADAVGDARAVGDRVSVLRSHLDGVLASLPPRERNVLRMRYGLGAPDGRTMTLSDISAAYGVTTERIRQIEDSGLRRLRDPARAAGVRRVADMMAEGDV